MTQVPASARDAVLARAVALSGDSRQLLEVAALTGARVKPRLIEAAAACPPAAVDALLASGLLTSDGAGLRFRHEIARLAVEQAIPAHRRAAIHSRILTVLRSFGPPDDARLAFHAEGADDAAAVLRHAPPGRPAGRRAGVAPGGRRVTPAGTAVRDGRR